MHVGDDFTPYTGNFEGSRSKSDEVEINNSI